MIMEDKEMTRVELNEQDMEKIVGGGEKFERIRRVTGYLAGDVSR